MTRGNVLVVEDDESIRRLLMEYLTEHAGLSVDTARDGADALHQTLHHRYNVVVLDVMMPFMSGIDFLDSIEAMRSDPSVPAIEEPPAIIIVTSVPPEDMPADEVQQRHPFVRAVLRKPVDTSALMRLVEQSL